MTRYIQPTRHPHGEQLSAYGDGMLDVAATRTVAEHLRVCPSCRQIVSQLEQTMSLLRAMPAPPRPGPEFWNDAYRRLRMDDREQAAPRRTPWDALRGAGQTTQRRWAAGLAAAAVIAAAVVAGPSVTTTQPTLHPYTHSIMVLPQDETPDVFALVESHTDSVSRLPLADPDRQKMIAADARQAQDAPEGAAYADGSF